MKKQESLTLNNSSNNKKLKFIAILALIFCSMFLLFPAGAIHPSTVIENTSEYTADISKNHTKNGKYLGLLVEPSQADKKVNNPYLDYLNLYSVFREEFATFAGVANADKSHSVAITDIDDGTNYSFLSADSGFGVKEYYQNDDGDMVYKQEFYPLELMFYSNHPIVVGSYSFLYISQSRADCLLDKKGLTHTRDNYQSLLNTLIEIDIDGTNYKFAIDNIYLEHNYFYEALHDVIGDFLFGGHKLPNGFNKQSLFFLRNFTFQNKFLIEHAKSLYSTKDFNFKLLEQNLLNNFKIDYSKIVFDTSGGLVGSIILLTLSILLLILALLLLFRSFDSMRLLSHIIVGITLLFPYLIFWIIYLFSKNVIWFSNLAVSCEMWIALAFIILYLLLLFFRKGKEKYN